MCKHNIDNKINLVFFIKLNKGAFMRPCYYCVLPTSAQPLESYTIYHPEVAAWPLATAAFNAFVEVKSILVAEIDLTFALALVKTVANITRAQESAKNGLNNLVFIFMNLKVMNPVLRHGFFSARSI